MKEHPLIVVGLDGSASSWKAFGEALWQAKNKNATLHVVSVQESVEASYSASEVLEGEQTARHKLEELHSKARHQAKEAGYQVTTVIATGNSASALVDYVKTHGVDLLVVGETGHSSIWGTLLGTTAEKIVRQARCSILIVR